MSLEQPIYDQVLAGTPLRALVINGFAGYCGYIGVPEEHCLADMDGLTFQCHGDITFRGHGDGDLRPEGWYWYGWDYQHLGCDKLNYQDGGVQELLPPELAKLLEQANRGTKEWTVPEIEQDLMDVAMELWDALKVAEKVACAAVDVASRKSSPTDDGPGL
jgi:hypothetical protein